MTHTSAKNIFTYAVFGGDLSGNVRHNRVIKIQNNAVENVAPTEGQQLIWSVANSQWEPQSLDINWLVPTGPSIESILVKSVNYTLADDDHVIVHTTGAANISLYLPATALVGRKVTILGNGVNHVTITAFTGTKLNGTLNGTQNRTNDSIIICYDGINWAEAGSYS